jgi:uncharacterized protein (DUF2141 family)
MMRSLILGILPLLVFLPFFRCANKVAPQGGPKDTLAPYVTLALPKNQSVNFTGNLIILNFNEWIKDNNLQKELLIAPPIKEYTTKFVRKRLEIRLKEPLMPNTTYSFNFRKGVADITETNIAVSDTIKRLPLKLAFSTGSFLDSLEVAGKVRDLLTNSPAKNALIALYRADDTLTLRKHAPYYFTQTDENGTFRVPNLKAGKYNVYAFQDADQSFSFQPKEMVDFLPKGITLPDTTAENIMLSLYKDDHTPAEILKSRAIGNEYEIVWNEYVREAKATFENTSQSLPYLLQNDHKTMRFFNPQALTDSIKLKLDVTDSLGNAKTLKTTIGFKIPEKPKKPKRTELALKLKPNGKDGFEEEVGLDFEFEQPVTQALLERIMVLIDNDTLKRIPLCFTDTIRHATWNDTKNVLTVKRKAFFKERLTVLADSGTFIGVRGDSSKTIEQAFSLKKKDDFASIGGSVRTDKKAFFLQLINEKGEVIRELRNSKTFNFQYLQGGTYRIRVLIDTNENGVWDLGDVDKLLPPEPVLFFELQNEGKLRDKWELQGHNISF